MANTLGLCRDGAVGFIEWLDLTFSRCEKELTCTNGTRNNKPASVLLPNVKSRSNLLWIIPWTTRLDVRSVSRVRVNAIERLADIRATANDLSDLPKII